MLLVITVTVINYLILSNQPRPTACIKINRIVWSVLSLLSLFLQTILLNVYHWKWRSITKLIQSIIFKKINIYRERAVYHGVSPLFYAYFADARDILSYKKCKQVVFNGNNNKFPKFVAAKLRKTKICLKAWEEMQNIDNDQENDKSKFIGK